MLDNLLALLFNTTLEKAVVLYIPVEYLSAGILYAAVFTKR